MKKIMSFLVSILFFISSCSSVDTSRPHYVIGKGMEKRIVYADSNLCLATRLMNNPIRVKCFLSDGSLVEYETNYFELVSPEEK